MSEEESSDSRKLATRLIHGGRHARAEGLPGHAIASPIWQTATEERRAAGVADTLVRISVGLEDPTDIIEDLCGALRSIGR